MNPQTFDVGRTPNEHLAFGIGEHFCLGANLGAPRDRLDLRGAACAGLPDLEFDGPVRRLRSNFINGIRSRCQKFTPIRITDHAFTRRDRTRRRLEVGLAEAHTGKCTRAWDSGMRSASVGRRRHDGCSGSSSEWRATQASVRIAVGRRKSAISGERRAAPWARRRLADRQCEVTIDEGAADEAVRHDHEDFPACRRRGARRAPRPRPTRSWKHAPALAVRWVVVGAERISATARC